MKLIAIKEKDPKNILKKIDWNCDSKGQSALMMTLDPNYMGYNLVIYHMKEQ